MENPAEQNTQKFWICTDCGASNAYPDITECEVCGKQIDDEEIKQVEKSFKDAQKEEEKSKRIEEKEAKLRKKQEIEIKRKEKYEQKQAEKQKKLEARQLKKGGKPKKVVTKKKDFDNESRFFNGLYKGLKLVKNCFVILLILSAVIVGISVFRQDSMDDIVSRAEVIEARVADDFMLNHYQINENGEFEFIPFCNIEEQFEYLKNSFNMADNLENLFDMLGW